MERITKRIVNKDYEAVVYIGQYKNYDTGDIPAEVQNAGVREILKYLAAYEDTGMNPKQIMKIANVFRQFGEEYNCWFDYVVDFVCKYAKAELDGRLVMLPCKVGDTVYRVAKKKKYLNNPKNTMYLKKIVIKPENAHKYISEIGKTVFLTRQEAEAVLKGESHGTNSI